MRMVFSASRYYPIRPFSERQTVDFRYRLFDPQLLISKYLVALLETYLESYLNACLHGFSKTNNAHLILLLHDVSGDTVTCTVHSLQPLRPPPLPSPM